MIASSFKWQLHIGIYWNGNTIIFSYVLISLACFQSFFIPLEKYIFLKSLQSTMRNIKQVTSNKSKQNKKKAVFLELKMWRAKQIKPLCKSLCKGACSRRHLRSALQKFTTGERGKSQGVYSRLSSLCGNSTVDTHSLWISRVAGHRSAIERARVKIRDLFCADRGEWRLAVTGSLGVH